MMVGRLLSFWDGIFSGAMLNFQGVFKENITSITCSIGWSTLLAPSCIEVRYDWYDASPKMVVGFNGVFTSKVRSPPMGSHEFCSLDDHFSLVNRWGLSTNQWKKHPTSCQVLSTRMGFRSPETVRKPLDAVLIFNRCCQRLSHGLKGVFQNIALGIGERNNVSFGPDYQK